MNFEFHAYPCDADSRFLTDNPEISISRHMSEAAARSKAGRLAKRINGPVDLAIAGISGWADRYLTTASPSEYHANGYRFERLS